MFTLTLTLTRDLYPHPRPLPAPAPATFRRAPLFCTTKTSNFLVTNYFYEGIVICAHPIFCFLCSCSLLFFTAAHFYLANR